MRVDKTTNGFNLPAFKLKRIAVSKNDTQSLILFQVLQLQPQGRIRRLKWDDVSRLGPAMVKVLNITPSVVFWCLFTLPLMASPRTRMPGEIPPLAQTHETSPRDLQENLKARADELFQQGNQHYLRSQYAEAKRTWEQALRIYRQVGDRRGTLAVLGNLGLAYRKLGDYEQAIAHHRQSLKLARRIESRTGEANALGNLGLVYDRLGRYKKAIAFHRQSLSIDRALGNLQGEAATLGNLGNSYDRLGDYDTALDFLQKNLDLMVQVGDRLGEGNALGNLGNVRYRLGEYENAIELYQRHLALARELEHRQGIGSALGNLGLAHSSLGQYAKALQFHQEALDLSREIRNPIGEATALGNLGVTHEKLGEYHQAIAYHQQHLALARQLGNQLGESNALGNLGIAHNQLKEYKTAIKFYRQSLTIDRQIGNRLGESTALGNLGNVYTNQGRYKKAIAALQQQLALASEIGHQLGKANALGNLGVAYAASGRPKHALEFYRQHLGLARQIKNKEGEGIALGNIGKLLGQLENVDLAISVLKQSVNVSETIRGNITGLSRETQTAYADTVAENYRTLADLLILQGRIAEAQQVIELLRVQELQEFHRDTRAPSSRSPLALNLAEQAIKAEHGSLIAFGQTFYNCEAQNCPELNTLRQTYKELDKAFFALATDISQSAQDNRQFQIVSSTDDFQASADKVVSAHPDSVLIYPLVLPDKVRLLWASKGGVLADEVCPLSEAALNQTIAKFQALLRSPDSDLDDVKQVGHELYNCLVKPIEAELVENEIKHLIFSPDRATNYIPLGALYDGQKFLVETYRVSNILSAGLTQTESRLPQNQEEISVLGLGVSDAKAGYDPLYYVPQELDFLVKSQGEDPVGVFPGTVYLNQAFTSAALENNLSDRHIVHIATHGEFVPTRPRGSYLLLGTGEKYPIPEIQTLRQLRDVHLVVLSACETATGGQDQTGIEVAGMSSYFLRDKAKAVLASLWKVNDASTSTLMQRFYQHLGTGQFSKAEAIRQAQLDLIRDRPLNSDGDRASIVVKRSRQSNADPNPAHPYYWAPFILIGNGL